VNNDQPPPRPPEKLSPGSWTEAEVDAMQGRRVRFKDGSGEGTVRDAIGHVGKDGTIYQYAVHLTPDGGVTILLNKGDSERGDWTFDVLPGPLVSEEERQALPKWGARNAAAAPRT
jgi:hypothetical protein